MPATGSAIHVVFFQCDLDTPSLEGAGLHLFCIQTWKDLCDCLGQKRVAELLLWDGDRMIRRSCTSSWLSWHTPSWTSTAVLLGSLCGHVQKPHEEPREGVPADSSAQVPVDNHVIFQDASRHSEMPPDASSPHLSGHSQLCLFPAGVPKTMEQRQLCLLCSVQVLHRRTCEHHKVDVLHHWGLGLCVTQQ